MTTQTKSKKCTEQELIDWLCNELDNCPCDWHVQDYYYAEGISIIFHTKEVEE